MARELVITIKADGTQATTEFAKVDRATEKTIATAEKLDKAFTIDNQRMRRSFDALNDPKVDAAMKRLDKSFGTAEKAVTAFEQDTRKLNTTFGITKEGVAKVAGGATATAAALGVFTTRAVSQASDVQDAMERMGIKSAESVQQLKYAAEQGGASLGTVDIAMKEMAKSLTGDKAAEQLISDLGLEVKKLRDGKPEDAFVTLTDAVKKIANPLEQAKAAMVLFGAHAGTELLPAIKAGFREIGDQAPVMSTAVVAAGDQVGDKLEALHQRFDTVTANALLPFAEFFVDTLPTSVQTGVVGLSSFLPSLNTVALGIFAAGGPMAAFTAVSTFLSTTLPAAATSVLAFLGPVGWIAAGLIGLGVVWVKWGDDIKGVVQSVFATAKQWLVDAWEDSILQHLFQMFEAMGKLFIALHLLVLEKVMAVYGAVKEWLVDKLRPVVDFLKPYFVTVAGWFTTAKDAIVGTVQALYTGIKTWLVDKFAGIVQGVKDKIDAVTGFFNDMYEKVVGHSYVPDMVTKVGEWFAKLGPLMVEQAEYSTQQVESVFERMAKNVGTAVGSAIFGGGSVTGALGSALGGGIGKMVGGALGKLIPIPGVGSFLGSLAGGGIQKLTGWIGSLFGKSKINKERDQALMDFTGINDLDQASDKVRELGFAAGISDSEMRSLFATDKVDDFRSIFEHVTDTITAFNLKTAQSLQAMKDELATPVVIPVTFGMLSTTGFNNTDMFSPRNFASFADWSQNWLGRNPHDEHRLNEALGGQNPWGDVPQFDTGGGVPGRGPRRAIVHGGEGVLSRRGMAALDRLNSGQDPSVSTKALEKEMQGLRASFDGVRNDLARDRQTKMSEMRAALQIARGQGGSRL
jgi:hypothetical protein